MGHRANYVLKDSSGYRLYYSHWGANVVERDLFWGPERAEQFIRSQRPMEEWLDDVWCEGGACLDCQKQELLFFGGEDVLYDPFLREGYLTLMRESWAPWKVRWAHRGILDLAEAAGVDAKVVLSANQDESAKRAIQDPVMVTADRLWCQSVLQLDERLYTLVTKLEGVLLNGPSLLEKLPTTPKAPLLEEIPTGGAFLHTEQRHLRYWCLDGPCLLQPWLESRWPGWTVERDHKLAVDQARHFCSLVDFKCPNWDEITEQIRASVCETVKSRALNLDGLKAIHGEDAEIEVNPLATEDTRPEQDQSADERAFQQILDAVEQAF